MQGSEARSRAVHGALSLPGHSSCSQRWIENNITLCQQEIQLQLKESEQTDKSDDSPVTIADYGELAQRHSTCQCHGDHSLALQGHRRWWPGACNRPSPTPLSRWWLRRTLQTSGEGFLADQHMATCTIFLPPHLMKFRTCTINCCDG